MKMQFMAPIVLAALMVMPVSGLAQQGSGQAGKNMMGGQQGSMMQNGAPMGQGQMMPDMTEMMHRMSDMMGQMSDMMKSVPAGGMQDMSALMGRMSRQMDEMSQAMARGGISDSEMRTMQENMTHMQNRLSEIRKN